MNFDLLIKKAKEANITEIEIYSQHKQGLNINLFNRKVDKFVINNTKGIAVRGLYNNQMGYVSCENLSDDNIDFIIQKLIDNAGVLTSEEESIIFEGSNSYPEVKPADASFLSIDPQVKIERLQKLEDAIKKKDPRITSVGYCMYNETKIDTMIQNSKGLHLIKSEAYCFVYASAVAKDNDDVKSFGDYIITNDFNKINIEELANNIVDRAVALLNSSPVQSDKYPIIFENKVFADILQAYEPMFSGDSVLRKLTLLKDKLGDKIVSDKITLIDDPLSTESYSQNAFDDEGVSCYRKEIISNGVLNTFLHNLKTAHALNTKSTGNGFKAGLNAPVSVQSNNLYIKKGTTSINEMIKSIDRGLLITEVAGLHAGVNAVSGDFSLQSSGFLIENKKITRPVSLIVVAGNFLDMLNQVEFVGDDLIFTAEQIGSPSVKISGLQVSGK
ncbi:TldD/PmbA family protein [Mycoplasmatota bacterium]|nr:TldD/PmbA family protein [Mycoplasmatota bacterium]